MNGSTSRKSSVASAVEHDFRAAADALPTATWLSDSAGRPIWFNRAWREASPHADANIAEGTWDGVAHPNDAPRREAQIREACKSQRGFTSVHRFTRHGTAIWVRETAAPVLTGDRFDGLVGTWHETEAAVEAAAPSGALSQVESRLTRLDELIQSVPGVVWEAWNEPDESAGRVDYVSRHVEYLLGFTREEWLSTPQFWLTRVHPDDRQMAAETAAAHFKRGGFGLNAFRWIARKGQTRHVLAYGTVLTDANGKPMGMRGVTIDISERVAIEDALREQTSLYQSLLTAQSDLGEGVVIFGDSQLHFCNPAFRRMTGHTEAELTRLSITDLVAPEDRGLFTRRLGVRRPRRPRAHEARIVTRAGHTRLVEITLKPLNDAPDRRWIAVVRDITDRRAAEEELAAARREVAQSEKLSLLGSLVSGLAHEIRTPLAYLDNHVTLLEARVQRAIVAPTVTPDLLEDLPGHAAAAHEGVDRINRLVKDLRRFIRMEVSTRQSMHLEEVVEDALRLYESAHNMRTHIESDLAPAGIVDLDAAQIQQVVINLIDNALDASPQRESVTVETARVGNTAQIIVRDRGIGIPADVLARMYDPFFSTKTQGTGLGLAIVRRIVEAHGGTIGCESQVGKGTTFTVSFPAIAKE